MENIDGKTDPKKEIELIKEQYKMIKEERKEEKAEKLRQDAVVSEFIQLSIT